MKKLSANENDQKTTESKPAGIVASAVLRLVINPKSAIEWTASFYLDLESQSIKEVIGRTWNPSRGCTICSPGCIHCYAMVNMAMKNTNPRLPGCHGFAFFDERKNPHWTGKVEFVPAKLNDPLAWKTPCRIFVNSMSDLFHEDLPVEGIQEVFRVMKQAYGHQFQILTKRSKRLAELAPQLDWASNIHMGVSVESPEYFCRIDDLRKVPAAVRFVSLEPLIAPLTGIDLSGIQWAIVGGESGPGYRPTEEHWVIELRDLCEQLSIPFFFKQWGGVHKKKAGRILEGKIYTAFPVLFPGEAGFPVIDAPSEAELDTLPEPTDDFVDVEIGNREQQENQNVFPASSLVHISGREQGTKTFSNVFPKPKAAQEGNREHAKTQTVSPKSENAPMKYQQKRKEAICLNCQEPKPIHAHGLCVTCYRADERAHQRAEDTQLVNAAARKERKRLLKAYNQITTGLLELGIRSQDIAAIKQILAPYLETIKTITGELVREEGTS